MFILLIFICILSLLFCQITMIDVGGIIREDTVWTATYNPYRLVDDIQVLRDITLTIKENVQIIYDDIGDFEILVEGSLQVQGTSDQDILFNGTMTINNFKHMLTFKSANLLQSSISHARFIGSKGSIALVEVSNNMSFNTGQLIFQCCTFTNTQLFTFSPLMYPSNNHDLPALIIQNSTIINSMILGSRTNGFSPILKLIGSQLQNMTIDAMSLYNIITLADCYGHDVTIYWHGYSLNASFEISNTNLTNVFISQRYSCEGQSIFSIRRSILHNTTILLAGSNSSAGEHYLDIVCSKLTVPRAIEMQTGAIQNSTITNFGNSLNITGILAGSVSIISSSIFNFDVGLRIFAYNKPMNAIKNSNFYKNLRYNIMNLGEFDVNATRNWWGTQTNIDETLYDNSKNMKYGKIYYGNFAQNQIEEQC